MYAYGRLIGVVGKMIGVVGKMMISDGAGLITVGAVISTGDKTGPATGVATNNGLEVATGDAETGAATAVETGDN